MKYMKNKYVFFLFGLFLAVNLTLHPLEHTDSDNLESEVECEFCINELIKPITSDVSPQNLVPFKNLSFGITENVDSFDFKNFSSRAPPKI
jgi:hypothetical protein|tara:strand:+ start:362 stop:634 length:273 start_codon:yes stop_codon:yes gene_type:complete